MCETINIISRASEFIFLLLKILAMQWIVSPEPPPPKVDVHFVENLLLTEGYTSAIDKVQWLKTDLSVSKEQIEQVIHLFKFIVVLV